jgi:hypothetical protein
MQSEMASFSIGIKAGQQSGDFLYSTLNAMMTITVAYTFGDELSSQLDKVREFIQSRREPMFNCYVVTYHSQILVLQEGLHILDEDGVDNIPTEKEILSTKESALSICTKVHWLVRAYLFRRLHDVSPDTINIWSDICAHKHPLRPHLLWGLFFEGLTSYHLARLTHETSKWSKKGDLILQKFKFWSNHSTWNFENKMLLLEAEKMNTGGNAESAAHFYERAIQSSHEHNFIHEEAISCELAGIFFYQTGRFEKSHHYLMHSIECFKKWGATAVARRVETFTEDKFSSSPGHLQLDWVAESILTGSNESSKKRHDRE